MINYSLRKIIQKISRANKHKQPTQSAQIFNPKHKKKKQIWFSRFEKGKKISYKYKHWRANKKVMDVINKKEKPADSLRNYKKQKSLVQI